jgi:hypothetical protein
MNLTYAFRLGSELDEPAMMTDVGNSLLFGISPQQEFR